MSDILEIFINILKFIANMCLLLLPWPIWVALLIIVIIVLVIYFYVIKPKTETKTYKTNTIISQNN